MPGWVWTVIGILLLIWLLSLLFDVGASIAWIVLVIAAVVLIIGLFSRGRAV